MPKGSWMFNLIAGLCATAALLGLLLLGSRLTTLSFVPLDIADAMIRLTPGAVATQGIEQLGPLAKMLIELTGSIVFLIFGGALGWLYGRIAPRPVLLVGVVLAVIAYGLTALAQAIGGRASAGAFEIGLTAVLYLAWGSVLAWLVNRLTAQRPVANAAPAATERRTFLTRSGGTLLAVAVGSSGIAQLLAQNGVAPEVAGAGAALPNAAPTNQPTAPATPPTAAVAAASSPAPTSAAAPTTASATGTTTPPEATASHPVEQAVPPFMTAAGTREPFNNNETLYIISSNTRDPQVASAEWKLQIGGAVNTPFSLTYAELLALPSVQQTSTMECISNEVGNYLIGNGKWTGIRLTDLLARAGIQDGVIDIKLTAAEGYTESIPLERANDPNTLIVYGIDGQALAVKHGFPARLRVPGLYGEKNVKWLTKIEAVREDYKGYWQQRGWTDTAIIETTAVIDTGNPRLGDKPLTIANGIVPLGGIAFAGDRGISKVEVQIDNGEWQAATLDPAENKVSWRFWRYDWQAQSGKHTLAVRAVDGSGKQQTEAVRDTHPDGATGYHKINVTVA